MSSESPVVFVVDDDRAFRDALRRLLTSVGLTVEAFPSAQAFLSSPGRHAPGCLVLDVRLPGLSGLDLQQELANTTRRCRSSSSPGTAIYPCRFEP